MPASSWRPGLDGDQLGGEIRNGFGDALLRPLPALAAELAELRAAVEAPDVLLHQVDLADRHMDDGVVGELDREVLVVAALALERFQTEETANAVQDVDDVVAGVQVEEAVDRPGWLNPSQCPALPVAVEQLVMRDIRGAAPLEAAVDDADGGAEGRDRRIKGSRDRSTRTRLFRGLLALSAVSPPLIP